MKRVPTILMFALLWAMLLMNRTVPNQKKVMRGLRETLRLSTDSASAQNRLIPDRFCSEYTAPGRDRVQRYYERMKLLSGTVSEMQVAFDTLEKHVDTSRRHVPAATRSLFAVVTCDQLRRLRQFYPDIRWAFGRIIRQGCTGEVNAVANAILYPADSACVAMKELFNVDRSDDILATLTVLKNCLALLEGQMLVALYSDGMPQDRDDYGMPVIAFPSDGWVTPGSQVSARIFAASWNRDPWIRTVRPSSGTIELDDAIVFWRGRSQNIGWQRVHGSLMFWHHGAYERLQWGFRYYVTPRFAAIRIASRDVLHPGLTYRLSIAGSERFPHGSLSLAADGAIRQVDSVYLLTPQAGQTHLDVRLLFRHDAQTDTVELRRFRISNSFVPRMALDESGTPELSAELMKRSGCVFALPADPDDSTRIEVISYTVRIENSSADTLGVFPVRGATFTSNPELPRTIERLQPGDRIFIENATVREGSGRILHPADAYFRVR